MRDGRLTILFIALAALAISGCGGRRSAGPPRFASVVVTDQENGAVNMTTFAPDTHRVYVRFTLADVPADTIVKSVWIAEKTDRDPETTLGQGTLTVGAKVTAGRFWFTRPPLGWSPRGYRVELYLADRLAHTARFQVAAPAGGAPPSPAGPIGTITFAHGESNGAPDRPADHFRAGVSRVYAFFTFAGLKSDDIVRGVWTAGGRQILEKHLTLPEVFSGRTPDNGTLWLWIQWDNGAPAGSYQLEISVNGTVVQSGTFVVEQ